MRAVVYIPAAEPRAGLYLRRGKAQCKRAGDEFVGVVHSVAEAEAVRASGFAQTIVADPAHANDLVTWLQVTRPRGGRGPAAGLVALPVWEAIKERPLRLAAATAAVAGTAAAFALLPAILGPGGDRQLLVPAPTPPAAIVPTPVEAPRATSETEPESSDQATPPAGGSAGEATTPGVAPAPDERPVVPKPTGLPSAAPAPSEATTTRPVAPTPPAPSPSVQPSSPPVAQCLLRLEVLGIRLEVCLP